MSSKSKLTPSHKKTRINWATNYVDLGLQWKNVIFSDEKKFNLDGPDGCRKFWYHPASDKNTFLRRHSGGGSVMIWTAFSGSGKSELGVLEGHLIAQTYIKVLETNLLPLIQHNQSNGILFQQDNCPLHTAATKQWLSFKNINCME